MNNPNAPALRPYQKEGVAFLTDTKPALGTFHARFLADDPGLGKTAQALHAAMQHLQKYSTAQRILVLTPAIGRVSWAIEAPKWLPRDWSVQGVKAPQHGYPVLSNRPNRTLYVCSYDLMGVNDKVRKWLLADMWDVLILDEAHYLKNPAAKRTQYVYGNTSSATPVQSSVRLLDRVQPITGAVFLLSGTPTPNHSGEIYTHLSALGVAAGHPAPFNNRENFEKHFCRWRETIYGRQITGSKNQKELRAFCAPFLLRRRKSDVLTELPPIQIVDVPLDVSEAAKHTLLEVDKNIRAAMGDAVVNADDEALVAQLQGMGAHIATQRRAMGILKVGPAAAWIMDRLSRGVPKIIVFAHHRDVMDALQVGLAEAGIIARIDGSTSQAMREKAVHDFQNEPDVRVFLGQIQAAGTAITLTAASEVVMVEADWTPANNEQAISRAHRMGNTRGVLCHFLYVPGTIDARIMRIFRRKAAETMEIYETPAATP